jgi:hypothetical protein
MQISFKPQYEPGVWVLWLALLCQADYQTCSWARLQAYRGDSSEPRQDRSTAHLACRSCAQHCSARRTRPDHAGLSRMVGGQQGRIAWLTMQWPSSGLGMPADGRVKSSIRGNTRSADVDPRRRYGSIPGAWLTCTDWRWPHHLAHYAMAQQQLGDACRQRDSRATG